MSEEGELKKRKMLRERFQIKERDGKLWDSMFTQTTFRITGHYGEEHIFNLEAFGQILDEAKKELISETELSQVINLIKKYYPEGNFLKELIIKRLCTVYDFRRKWFGENNK